MTAPMGRVLPLFPDMAAARDPSDELDDAPHHDIGYTPPRAALRAVPAAPPPLGAKDCRRCHRPASILVSVGSSVERTHCGRCAGIVNSIANPRPWGSR